MKRRDFITLLGGARQSKHATARRLHRSPS